MITRDEATEELVRWHFQIAPEVVEIYRFQSDNEDAPDEPIKLLDVSEGTLSTGKVSPFGFGRTDEIPYPTVIAMITPEEMAQIRQDALPLPRGWSLKHSRRYSPPGPDRGHDDGNDGIRR